MSSSASLLTHRATLSSTHWARQPSSGPLEALCACLLCNYTPYIRSRLRTVRMHTNGSMVLLAVAACGVVSQFLP